MHVTLFGYYSKFHSYGCLKICFDFFFLEYISVQFNSCLQLFQNCHFVWTALVPQVLYPLRLILLNKPFFVFSFREYILHCIILIENFLSFFPSWLCMNRTVFKIVDDKSTVQELMNCSALTNCHPVHDTSSPHMQMCLPWCFQKLLHVLLASPNIRWLAILSSLPHSVVNF